MRSTTKSPSYSLEHVTQRALERYNLILTPADYQRLNEIIQATSQTISATDVVSTEERRECRCRLLGQEGTDEFYGVSWPRTPSRSLTGDASETAFKLDPKSSDPDAGDSEKSEVQEEVEVELVVEHDKEDQETEYVELICVWNKKEQRVTTLLPPGTAIRSRRERIKKMK